MEKSINKYRAIFSGQELKLDNENFSDSNITAVFGGIDLDLTKAIISSDIEIKARSFFGGIDIILPEDVNVIVKSFSLFGGVTNKKKQNSKTGKYTVTVRTTSIFGGVDLK